MDHEGYAFDITRLTPHAIADLGALPPGEAAFLILANAMLPLRHGQVLEARSQSPHLAQDLPSWCRLNQHDYLGYLDGPSTRRHLLRKGSTAPELPLPDWGQRLPLRDGVASVRDWLLGRHGQVGEAATYVGLVPRGAVPEPGGPDYGFSISRRDAVWADNLPALLEEAKVRQWNAATDIPWHRLPPLPDALERAVCQLMTFLAENEYAALYIPARFLPRINPHYLEAVLFLATVVHDEARHIEAFTKRALANGGGLQYSAAITQWSLHSLVVEEDYFRSSFLLHVLGEGTFLDLLAFAQRHAPDPVTREVLRRARADEARHVAYGVAHVAHLLRRQPHLQVSLADAAARRHDQLQDIPGANPRLLHALAVLAGGGDAPHQVAAGLEQVKTLYDTMHRHRVQRMVQAGLDRATAQEVSHAHTPNFM